MALLTQPGCLSRIYLCLFGIRCSRKYFVRFSIVHRIFINSCRLLINEEIGPSNQLNWVATTWVLGSAIGFLLVGRLSDIFGRKWMVIGCQILSIIGMIIGATAQNMNVLIAANLLNGISAAGQLSFGIIIGELVPNKYRGPAISIIFSSSLPFAVFGGTIGRDFIEHTAQTFRWSYYLGIILSTLSLIMYVIWYNPPTFTQLHVRGMTKWEQFKQLDFIGLLLFLAGTIIFLIGCSWGGQTYPWKSKEVIATLIVGGLCIIGFVLFGK
jgi:MFS family permease